MRVTSRSGHLDARDLHPFTHQRRLHRIGDLVDVAFVERMIGARPGTGGGGVEYLRKTLDLPRAFPWLWDFRTILMAPAPA